MPFSVTASRSTAMQHGFTLIELLVTVSIIALLIAILMPALSSARAVARGAVCLSQLRQVGLAAQMYADDHDGYIKGPWMFPDHTSATKNELLWHYGLYDGSYLPERTTFICPEAAEYDFMERMLQPNEPDWVLAHLPYGLNIFFFRETSPVTNYNSRPFRLYDSVHPAVTLFVADTRRIDSPTRGRFALQTSGMTVTMYNDSRMDDRHSGATNVLYLDGHAKSEMDGYRRLQLEAPASHYGFLPTDPLRR